MAGYEWAAPMADKRGEALESFVATILLRRYPAGIRQVNPPRIKPSLNSLYEQLLSRLRLRTTVARALACCRGPDEDPDLSWHPLKMGCSAIVSQPWRH
jgi:hypothetical protein